MKNIYYKLLFLLSVLLMTGCSTFAKHNYNRQNDLYNFVKRNVQKSNFFASV